MTVLNNCIGRFYRVFYIFSGFLALTAQPSGDSSQGDFTDSSEPASSTTTANQSRAVTTVTQATPTPGPSIPVSFSISSIKNDQTDSVWCGTYLPVTVLQEISSLVGEDRAESSEAIAVVMGAEGEEPMHTDQSEDVMSSGATVLQVHLGAGDATQVKIYTTVTL